MIHIQIIGGSTALYESLLKRGAAHEVKSQKLFLNNKNL